MEFYANNGADRPDWWLAERTQRRNYDASGRYVETVAARYMDDPPKDNVSPACWYSGLASLDVHYSSGPANYMFYLLAHGGTSKPRSATNPLYGNCPLAPVTVPGIGNQRGSKIWYDALALLGPGATYADARLAATTSAKELYDIAEIDAVGAAFSAISVVIGDSNGDGTFSTADLNVLVDWVLGRVAMPPRGTNEFVKTDVNGDGALNNTDINLFVDRLLERISRFPIEP